MCGLAAAPGKCLALLMAPCWFENGHSETSGRTIGVERYTSLPPNTPVVFTSASSMCTIGVECADLCPVYKAPLCSTRGVTFSNDCFLNQAAFRHQPEIDIQNVGQCEGAFETSWFGVAPVRRNICLTTLICVYCFFFCVFVSYMAWHT